MAKYPIYEDTSVPTQELTSREHKCVSWVMDHVVPWRDDRDSNFKDKWEEFYRINRGIWSAQDRTRDTERSRLISPASAQAVEVAVSEMEESLFGKKQWFDVSDDALDFDDADVLYLRKVLLEDFALGGVQDAMASCLLNGALYGTLIGKIVVELEDIPSVVGDEDTRVVVRLVPVEPDEFVIDPAARNIEESLGVAQESLIPRHKVTEKQKKGIYKQCTLGSYFDDLDLVKDDYKHTKEGDLVKITEWHGKVPSVYLDVDLEEGEELVEFDLKNDYIDEHDLVEAIITIANDTKLLRAVENPYTMKDRGFVAAQWERVPNQFHGRGVIEKGYNSQKALDAELRGRMDAMSLAIHPMLAVDATRVPRGSDLSVKPGRMLLTNGDPRQVLMPFNFGQVGTNTFQQSGEFERMIQMATGSMDSATPVGISPRNGTLGGMSMIQASSIKRSRRTLLNIEKNFVQPFIQKAAWRYMQYATDRYPVADYTFYTHSSLGIMARELEQQQLTSLLQTVPPESPAFWILIRGIFDNSSMADKEEIMPLIEQLMQEAMQPEDDQSAQIQAMQLQYQQQVDQMKLQIEQSRAETERMRVQIEGNKAQQQNRKTQAETANEVLEGELAVRKQALEEKRLELEAQQKEFDKLLASEKLEVDKHKAETEREKALMPPPEPPEPEKKPTKKKVVVQRTSDGRLEGYAEAMD